MFCGLSLGKMVCQERWFRVNGSWVFEERSGKADRLELRRDSAISEQAQMALAAPSLSSQLGLPKEFTDMEQKLQEMHTKEDDSLFYYHSSEVFNPCIIAVPSLEGL